MELEKAGRVADFLEFGEVMCYDALDREESCGGHFRVEHQFFENDPEVSPAAPRPARPSATTTSSPTFPAGNTRAPTSAPILHKEPLVYEEVKVSIRSYA